MGNFRIVDGHAHLNELKELGEALNEARRKGIAAIIGVGVGLESNQSILEIAEQNPGFVFAAVGYHPWNIKETEISDNLAFIEDHVERCVAIGEVGLDYKAKVKKDMQKAVFHDIVKLSIKYHKTLILHCRYSHERVFSMISDKVVKSAVFHWYTGTLDLLEKIIDSGHYISATPALAYSPQHQVAIRKAPLENILLETDCPVRYQGHISRPADVITTLQLVAELKGLLREQVAERTSENANKLFRLFQ